MATVRTTTPRHDVEVDAKGKKKRKRTASSAKGKTRGAQTNPNPGTPPHAGVRTSTTAMHASNLPGNSFADDMVRRKLDAHDKWQLCTQKSTSCVCISLSSSVLPLELVLTAVLFHIVFATMMALFMGDRYVGDSRGMHER